MRQRWGMKLTNVIHHELQGKLLNCQTFESEVRFSLNGA